MSLAAGQRVQGRYEILRRLGEGGMGVVYVRAVERAEATGHLPIAGVASARAATLPGATRTAPERERRSLAGARPSRATRFDGSRW